VRKFYRLFIGTLLFLAAGALHAADIRVLAGGFYRPVLLELGPKFERATGHKLVVKWVPGPAVGREVDAGEPFDIAVAQSDVMEDLARRGKVDAAPLVALVRVGLALGVPAGSPRPDVSTVDGFKKALLDARIISTSPGSVSGAHLARLLDQWGLAAQVGPKVKAAPVGTGGAFEMVAKGGADLGFASAALLPGMELVTALPEELQIYQVFIAGLATQASDKVAARALLTFLSSEEAAAVVRSKAMQPGWR
jgi:molybdate transport system substrate-binding protein